MRTTPDWLEPVREAVTPSEMCAKRDVYTRWNKLKHENVCKDCGQSVTWRFVATGRDHTTDQTYAQCTCPAPSAARA